MKCPLSYIVLALVGFSFLSCSSRMSDSAAMAYVKAKNHYLSGEIDQCLTVLQEGNFTYRSGHQAKLLEAKCLFMQKNTKDARKILERLLTKNRHYTDAILWLARTHLAEQDPDKAESLLESAVRHNSEDPRLLYLLGATRETNGDYQQALEYYKRATLYGDDLARSEISLAQVYYRFNQTDKALQHVVRAKALLSEGNVLHRPLKDLQNRLQKETTQ